MALRQKRISLEQCSRSINVFSSLNCEGLELAYPNPLRSRSLRDLLAAEQSGFHSRVWKPYPQRFAPASCQCLIASWRVGKRDLCSFLLQLSPKTSSVNIVCSIQRWMDQINRLISLARLIKSFVAVRRRRIGGLSATFGQVKHHVIVSRPFLANPESEPALLSARSWMSSAKNHPRRMVVGDRPLRECARSSMCTRKSQGDKTDP